MKRLTTSFMAITMTAIMAASMAGCGSGTNTKSDAAATTESVGLANPVSQVTEEEMVEKTSIDLPAPDGATDVSYSVIDMGEGENSIAQMTFTYNGDTMYLRACLTDLLDLNPVADGTESTEEILSTDMSTGDISGLNYEWTASGTYLVQERDALYNVSKEGAGYIAWVDAVPGVLYNLCMTENADYEKLANYAEEVFVPVQGED